MKIGIAGYTGRVGQLLVKELQSGAWNGLTLSGGTTRQKNSESFPIFNDIEKLFAVSDCVIDFTTPESTLHTIHIAVEQKKITGDRHDRSWHRSAKHHP